MRMFYRAMIFLLWIPGLMSSHVFAADMLSCECRYSELKKECTDGLGEAGVPANFASLSKSIVGLLYLQDYQKGEFSKSTTVGEYLKGKYIKDKILSMSFDSIKDVVLFDLLTMKSEIRNTMNPFFSADLQYKGSYKYNNTGYYLLGKLWEERHSSEVLALNATKGLGVLDGVFPPKMFAKNIDYFDFFHDRNNLAGAITGSCEAFSNAIQTLSLPLLDTESHKLWEYGEYNFGLRKVLTHGMTAFTNNGALTIGYSSFNVIAPLIVIPNPKTKKINVYIGAALSDSYILEFPQTLAPGNSELEQALTAKETYLLLGNAIAKIKTSRARALIDYAEGLTVSFFCALMFVFSLRVLFPKWHWYNLCAQMLFAAGATTVGLYGHWDGHPRQEIILNAVTNLVIVFYAYRFARIKDLTFLNIFHLRWAYLRYILILLVIFCIFCIFTHTPQSMESQMGTGFFIDRPDVVPVVWVFVIYAIADQSLTLVHCLFVGLSRKRIHVYWDSDCGICTHFRNAFENRSRNLIFTPSKLYPHQITREAWLEDLRNLQHTRYLACETHKSRFLGSKAVLIVFLRTNRLLGTVLIFAMLMVPFSTLLGDVLYRLVAANRTRISKAMGLAACSLDVQTDFPNSDPIAAKD